MLSYIPFDSLSEKLTQLFKWFLFMMLLVAFGAALLAASAMHIVTRTVKKYIENKRKKRESERETLDI